MFYKNHVHPKYSRQKSRPSNMVLPLPELMPNCKDYGLLAEQIQNQMSSNVFLRIRIKICEALAQAV